MIRCHACNHRFTARAYSAHQGQQSGGSTHCVDPAGPEHAATFREISFGLYDLRNPPAPPAVPAAAAPAAPAAASLAAPKPADTSQE